jgi:hypothetical protein
MQSRVPRALSLAVAGALTMGAVGVAMPGIAAAAVTGTANPDAATVGINDSVDIDLLANDDLSGGAGARAVSLDTTAVGHGTATVDAASGVVTYEAGDTVGVDTFSYTVTDSSDPTAPGVTGTVTVTVDGTPQAYDDSTWTGDGRSVDIWPSVDSPDGIATLAAVTTPAHGVVHERVRDGQHRLEYTPEGTFAGTDEFTYRATDPDGDTSDATITVYVQRNNDVEAEGDDVDTTGPVLVDVLDNDLVQDGVASLQLVDPQPSQGTATVEDGKVRYVPNAGASGWDAVYYRVTDKDGDIGEAGLSVWLPSGEFRAWNDGAVVRDGQTVTVDVLANDELPPGDVTVSLHEGAAPVGTATVVGNAIVYTAPDPAALDSFMYDVTDKDGNTETAWVTFEAYQPVHAYNDELYSPQHKQWIDVLSNDEWYFDGYPQIDIPEDGEPSHGRVAIADDWALVYTPDENYSGIDQFDYVITGPDGDTSRATVYTLVSFGPEAEDDVVTTSAGTPVTVDVLANDSVPAGVADIQLEDVENGAAKVVDGRVVYTPKTPEGAEGPVGYGFEYRVVDKNGDDAYAWVTVNLLGDRAVLLGDDDLFVSGRTVLDVFANDSLGDGDVDVTVSGSSAYDVQSAQTTHGTVVVVDGTVVYTPDEDYRGDDWFSYAVTDADGDADYADVDLQVGTGHGVVANDETLWVADGAPTDLDVLANDSIPDGHAQVMTDYWSEGPLSISGYDYPWWCYGGYPEVGVRTLSLEDDGCYEGTFRVVDGTKIRYTSARHGVGDVIDYRVIDRDGDQDWATLTVKVNRVPKPGAPAFAAVGGHAKDLDVRVGATDKDGHALSVAGVGTPDHGTASIVNGLVRYTAPATYTGPATFTFVLDDGHGGTATGMASVDVTANKAPVPAADALDLGTSRSGRADLLAGDTDPDGDALSIVSVDGGRNGATVSLAGSTVTYTAKDGFTGSDVVTYVVRDPLGATATGQLLVSVGQATTLNVVGDLAPSAVLVGEKVAFRGAVAPYHGVKLALQKRRAGGSWATVTTRVLPAGAMSGQFSFAVPTNLSRTSFWRVAASRSDLPTVSTAVHRLRTYAVTITDVSPDGDEYVEVTNTGKVTTDFYKWVLRDKAGHRLALDTFRMRPGKTVRIYTGDGRSTTSRYYVGSGHRDLWGAKETVRLFDRHGALVGKFRYGGKRR